MAYHLVIQLLLYVIVHYADANVSFEIVNREPGPFWLGIQGNPGHEHLEGGGIALEQGQRITISAPGNWSGRFWPRTWCDAESKHCATGSCGERIECQGTVGTPPATFIEITLKDWEGLDYYDISLVNGFNLRAFIEPLGGEGPPGPYSCTRISCVVDVNAHCPPELKVVYSGQIIACNSACTTFNTDEYCCRGDHDRPETCNSTTWPRDYPAFFKKECPDAYSYAFDAHKGTFTCKSQYYRIQFGVH